jgi:hypothetical protein
MPQEWSDEPFAKLCYKMPDKRMLEVAVLQSDDNLVLHWCPFNPTDSHQSGDVHSTTISTAALFSDSDNGAQAYVREQLRGLIDKFAPGIDLVIQVLLPNHFIDPADILA